MIKPIGARVLIKPVKEETKLAGGIVQPQSNDMKPMSGFVVSCGDELADKAEWLNSAKVYYPRYTGAEVEVMFEGKRIKLLIVEYEDLLGIETGEQK